MKIKISSPKQTQSGLVVVWVIVVVIIVSVGGFMAYKLYKLSRDTKPRNPEPDGDVSRQFIQQEVVEFSADIPSDLETNNRNFTFYVDEVGNSMVWRMMPPEPIVLQSTNDGSTMLAWIIPCASANPFASGTVYFQRMMPNGTFEDISTNTFENGYTFFVDTNNSSGFYRLRIPVP